MLEQLRGPDLLLASNALLSLTYHEDDRDWLQTLLIDCVARGSDRQLRALSVTCMGHVARLDGVIRDDVLQLLRDLRSDPDLGGTAEDALDDVTSFADRR
jgi:uncharacterized membrane protein YheB (UPF0754 family)